MRFPTSTLSMATALLALSASPASAAPSGAPGAQPNTGLAKLLDAMARRGELRAADATRLSHLARAQGAGPRIPERSPSGRAPCLTQAMIQAKAWAHSQGAPVFKTPPPSTGSITSTKAPLRVYYSTGDEGLAKQVMASAEATWAKQITDVGYPQPYTDGDLGPVVPGLWIYVASTGMGGGGYTEPLDDVPSTPVSDCSSRVVVDPENPPDFIEDVVVHELNHTTQMATDCAETISAWENFATAVEHTFNPYSYVFSQGFLPEFQDHPEMPIDFWTQDEQGSPNMYYQYGAALFPVYLRDRFGGGDVRILRDLWYSFAQKGTVTVNPWGIATSEGNDPHWFKGSANVLATKGTSFDEAFDEFTVWRSITGKHDDGAHFKVGKQYETVRLATSHSLKSLPAKGTFTLREYGSRHIELRPDSFTGSIRASVTVDPAASWGGSVLLWRGGKPVERIKLGFQAAAGEATVPSLAGVSRAMLVVSQRKDATHEPDDMEYDTERKFSYAIESLEPPDAGPGPDAAPPDAGDAGTDTTPPVPEAATWDANKPKDSGSKTDSGAPAVEEPATPQPAESGGCGCRTVSGAGSAAPVGLVIAMAAAAGMRRRKPGPRGSRDVGA
jgi:MYXO-CTERM domain-containing protein